MVNICGDTKGIYFKISQKMMKSGKEIWVYWGRHLTFQGLADTGEMREQEGLGPLDSGWPQYYSKRRMYIYLLQQASYIWFFWSCKLIKQIIKHLNWLCLSLSTDMLQECWCWWEICSVCESCESHKGLEIICLVEVYDLGLADTSHIFNWNAERLARLGGPVHKT